MSTEPAAENLRKIEHIVVLMLENRSFDHMLGYLSLEGGRTDVDGLKSGMSNDAGGRPYPVEHLNETHIPNPRWDPDHSSTATDKQINGGRMDGFAASFAETLASRGVPDPDPGMVMGYYNAGDLPVYDHLAEHFCVCDRWHSSVPGATWPNRLYAVAGSADGSRDDNTKPLPIYGKPLPIYAKHSFVRHLDAADVNWRWYTYDVGTLRCVDRDYRLGHHGHFAYVERSKLPLEVMLKEELLLDEDSASFLEDAQRGRLAPVSWIDPNFKDLNLAHVQSNDDHPPSDVGAGQELVMLIYNALASGPLWEKTLFLVVYDEHGGFHDHVPPPEAPDDDPAMFGRYGVRVPALAVSPWIPPRSIAATLFDHTSIIKTILTRFAPAELQQRSPGAALIHWLEEGHPHYMGKRVAHAEHLGGLLSEQTPRPAPDRTKLTQWLADRHANRAKKLVGAPVAFPAEQRIFTDLQRAMLAAEKHIHDEGHPPGQP
jgi:phospholipase C